MTSVTLIWQILPDGWGVGRGAGAWPRTDVNGFGTTRGLGPCDGRLALDERAVADEQAGHGEPVLPFGLEVAAEATGGAVGCGGNNAKLVDGAHFVAHNVRVDWNLLHRELPALKPTELLDTLRLIRALRGKSGNGLSALMENYELTANVGVHVPNG